MNLEGKKFQVLDEEILIQLASCDSLYVDDTMIVRVFLSTNLLFGVHFYLQFKADQVFLFISNGLGRCSFKTELDISKENYAKLLKLKLMSYADNDDFCFEYSVDLLRQVLPIVVLEYHQRFRDCYKQFHTNETVVL